MVADARSLPRLLIVDDDRELRELLRARFEGLGMAAAVAGGAEEAQALLASVRCDVALLDLGCGGLDLLARVKEQQPEMEVILLTADSSVQAAVQAMKQGAYDYLSKPLCVQDLAVHVHKAFEKVQLTRRANQWAQQVRTESPRHRLVGNSPPMRRVSALIEKVAGTSTTVLICGQSGTGKEVVARTIHAASGRRDRPMVTINCAALQEVAEGGTLFIDEIGEMAIGLQAKLLRVLEDGHYRRVGATAELHADVRVIAATNRRLEDEMRSGRFREDLYYRLNVLTIHLPPLRERRQDIPELVEHFLSTRPIGPARCRVTPEALEALVRYDWPGNVRELANVLERAQILAEEQCITIDDLPENLAGIPPGPPDEAEETANLYQAQRRHVVSVLREARGNKVHAARALGISRRALYRLLDKYGIRDERKG